MARFIVTAQKPKRGKARPTAQLSELQCSILYWILEERRQMSKTSDTRDEYDRSGVKWSTKSFYATLRDDFNLNTTKVILSKSLERLEKRGLLVRLKQSSKTNRVRLTPSGIEVAVVEEIKLMQKRSPEDAINDRENLYKALYQKALRLGKNPIFFYLAMLSGFNSLSESAIDKALIEYDTRKFFKNARIDPAILQAFQNSEMPCDSEEEFLEFVRQTISS